MLSSDSQAQRGLPDRFTISLSFLAPTIPRESAARGVFFIPSARISSARPGIFLSAAAPVASGVTSRGPSPVPPVPAGLFLQFLPPAFLSRRDYLGHLLRVIL
jgi:hypothetical protein